MKKLIALVLLGALGFGAYRMINSRGMMTAMVKEPEQAASYMADQVMSGDFMSLLSDEQMEKIVEKVKNSGILQKSSGILRDFLDSEGVENIQEKLADKAALETVRDEFMDYLTERYCQEKGVPPEQVTEDELRAYQKEVITQMIQDTFQKLK